MLKWFESNTPNKLIGNNLMTEHVHPNIDGSFLMAEAFYKEILNSNLIAEKNQSPGYSLEYKKRNWGYTLLDSLIGEHRVQMLKGYWPFVLDEKHEVDFKKVYIPGTFEDSIVFSVLLNSETNL